MIFLRRAGLLVLAMGILLFAPAGPTAPPPAQAHPLGNFTVNHYDGLSLFPDRIEVLAILDTAEIPTVQERAGTDTDGDGTISAAEGAAHAAAECAAMLGSTTVAVDGTPAPFTVRSATVEYPVGEQSLRTTRVTCLLAAPAALSGRSTVEFTDGFKPDRIGWREITATGVGLRIDASDVPEQSISQELRAYPNDLLTDPLDQRSARIEAVPGSGAVAAAPLGGLPSTGVGWLDAVVGPLKRTFDGLVGSPQLTPLVGAAAIGLSILLGASHAALPGHGKTLIAAYLAGRAGSRRDAFVVGFTVTVTHTGGVLILGLAISALSAFAPEAILRWLGVASGLLIFAIGVGLLVSAVRRRAALALVDDRVPALAAVEHGHGHGHAHGHGHGHGHGLGGPERGERFGRRGLIGMGVASGLVPSPTALVVLVAAISLGRTWFGVGLVLAYGLGMAGVLTAVGLLLVIVRDRIAVSRLAEPGRVVLSRIASALPVATAVIVIVIGLALAVRGLAGSV